MKIKKKNGLEFYSKPEHAPAYKGAKNLRVHKLQYRWRVWRQGRTIAASSEAYSKLWGAKSNAYSVGWCLGRAEWNEINKAVDAYKSRKK